MDRLLATKREDAGLIVRAISFQDLQPMWSQITNFTDRRTDGRHVIPRPRICTKVHCAVKTLKSFISPTLKYLQRFKIIERLEELFYEHWTKVRKPPSPCPFCWEGGIEANQQLFTVRIVSMHTDSTKFLQWPHLLASPVAPQSETTVVCIVFLCGPFSLQDNETFASDSASGWQPDTVHNSKHLFTEYWYLFT